MFTLRSIQHPNWFVQVSATPIHIGRGADNSLVLRDQSVSRKHAVIQIEAGVPVLIDLNSTRGTYVNDKRVKRVNLKPGDLISFGKVQWQLEGSPPSTPPMPPSRIVSAETELVLTPANDPDRQYHLPESPISIGRGSGNQIRSSDITVSRQHAVIQFEEGQYIITDLNSARGTFVNGQRVKRKAINAGDMITFGTQQWRVAQAVQHKDIGMSYEQEPHSQQILAAKLTIGNYTIQTGSIHGGWIKHAPPEQIPRSLPRPSPVHIRPCHIADIIDRKAEVKAAASAGPKLPVEFSGPDGAGKSTLLCYLAHHPLAKTFPDGVVHLLARSRQVIDLEFEIFDTFYAGDFGFVPTRAEIRNFLQNKRALILLDDVELNSDEIEELMASAPECTFIFASSKNCLSQGGHSIEMGGFPLKDALELFENEFGRKLVPIEQSAAQALCTALGNNPARIVQAGSHMREVKQSLEDVGRILNVGAPIQALANLITQSLSTVEKQVIAVLASLSGASIHNRHISALAGIDDSQNILKRLQKRGLVREIDNRYALANNLAATLQHTWELSEWATRILTHFTRWAGKHQEQPEYVLFEIEAILAILTWAVRANHWKGILEIFRVVENLASLGKLWGVWGKILGFGLQAAQALGDQATQAWALHQTGTRAVCLGDITTAKSSLQQALQLRQSLGDKIGASFTQNNLNILAVAPPPPKKSSKPQPKPRKVPRIPRPIAIGGGIAATATAVVAIITIFNQYPAPVPPLPDTSTPTQRITATLTTAPIVEQSHTPSPAPTKTYTATPVTPVITPPTATRTPTSTYTSTKTFTSTSTNTSTKTITSTSTNTPTNTNTSTSTNTPTDTITPTPVSCNMASFVDDITIPDGMDITALTPFTKTWRLKNTGSCTWTSDYMLIFDSGDLMDGPEAMDWVFGAVTPGETADISVELISPITYGTHKGFWRIRAPSGEEFGVSYEKNVAFWVQIDVIPGARIIAYEAHLSGNSEISFINLVLQRKVAQ